MKPKTHLFLAICISVICLGQANSQISDNQGSIISTPKFNPNAVTVNSIAPDRGLADPHVLIVNDTLYAMCGHDNTWTTRDFCRMDRWELWSTTNLSDWDYVLSIRNVDTYIGEENNCWAGDLATKDGKYYWYFSNRYFNTGVMVAPSMHGPWVDALGEPLLPTGIVGDIRPYDPEIYSEDGENYIIFGAGQYYIATLGDDMISLKDEPQKVKVVTKDGQHKPTGDKPCMFKRNGKYYLVWGYLYAMADSLHGTYVFQGSFIDGGHGSVFEWDGQWYAIQENHEGNAFYRGVQLRPLYFNSDDTVYIPEVNLEYPLPNRIYNFKYTTQGWHAEGGGTEVNRREDGAVYLYGDVTKSGAIIASIPFLHTDLELCDCVKIKIHNESGARQMRLALNSYDNPKGFTRLAPKQVDWDSEEWIDIELSGRWEEEITIPLTRFANLKKYLHQIGLQPIADKSSGRWVLVSISVNGK